LLALPRAIASVDRARAMNPTAIARSEPDLDSAYAWTRLVVCVLLSTIGGVGLWAAVVIIPALQAEFAVDRAGASLPYTIAMFGFSAGNVMIGYAIDRWGYWRPALVASIALAAGFGLAAIATSIVQIALIHGLLIGIGSSAIFGPLIADISHWFERRRGIAVSIAAAGNYIAGAIWPLIMPRIMEVSNWRVTYAVIGGVCLVTMVPLVLLLRRRAPSHHGASAFRRTVKPIALSPSGLQILLSIAGLSCCAAMAMPQVHIVAYCTDLGYGVARGAQMLSLMLAGGVVSRLACGLLADRIGGVRSVLVGSVLQCLALFLYLPSDGLGALYLVSAVFGLSQGGIVPGYAIIIREYMAPQEAGRRVGIVMMMTTLGMALGGWMSGWIYDLTGSYAAAFMNGIAWNLLNIFVMTLVLWRSSGQMAARAA
jgi:MFS family permease